jgi:mediator of RNA polymerase II transcription subunit 5
MFLQSAIGRYKITPATLRANDKSVSADYLIQAGSIELSANLEEYERNSYQNWYKALFDPSSDGIDDALVR